MGSSGTSCPPQPHLEGMRTPPFLTYLEAFPRGDQSMKVVSYDPYDTAGPSGPLSGTSCPPQPHLEVKRTPPFLTYLEAFPRGDHSMKVVSYDPYNTAEPSGSLSGTSCPPQPHLEVMSTFLMYLETLVICLPQPPKVLGLQV